MFFQGKDCAIMVVSLKKVIGNYLSLTGTKTGQVSHKWQLSAT